MGLITILNRDKNGRLFVHETDRYGKAVSASQRRYIGPSEQEIKIIDQNIKIMVEYGEALLMSEPGFWHDYTSLPEGSEERWNMIMNIIAQSESEVIVNPAQAVKQIIEVGRLRERKILPEHNRRSDTEKPVVDSLIQLAKNAQTDTNKQNAVVRQLEFAIGESSKPPPGCQKKLKTTHKYFKILLIAYAKSCVKTAGTRDWVKMFWDKDLKDWDKQVARSSSSAVATQHHRQINADFDFEMSMQAWFADMRKVQLAFRDPGSLAKIDDALMDRILKVPTHRRWRKEALPPKFEMTPERQRIVDQANAAVAPSNVIQRTPAPHRPATLSAEEQFRLAMGEGGMATIDRD